MTQTSPSLNYTPCHVRHVVWTWPDAPCDRCGQPAPRFSTATRTAVDLDLDQPVLLLVTVDVHHCTPCHQYFRAQPPFLRPDAIYASRVVATAVASVYEDGMARTRVSRRLARDFWVRPSEAMIRRWCRDYARGLDFARDYQAWVIEEFSGVLCSDEVYQEHLALLLAVDPAAPDGDRLVGYQLVQGTVSAATVRCFLERLRASGVDPDEVITAGSPLYPATLAAVWPTAAQQLCLFHQTRRVTKSVVQVVREVRAAVPTPAGAAWAAPGGPRGERGGRAGLCTGSRRCPPTPSPGSLHPRHRTSDGFRAEHGAALATHRAACGRGDGGGQRRAGGSRIRIRIPIPIPDHPVARDRRGGHAGRGAA